jgi:flagellar motor switch protein FliG
METSIQEIVNSIDKLTTIDSAEDLNQLQEFVDLYFAHPQAGDITTAKAVRT